MNYIDFTPELLENLETNDRLIREMHFSHSCCDMGGKHLFYCTMYKGSRYKTSIEQKETASKLYAINKDKKIKSLGNKLVFVGMGMEYPERYEDDVCNHRIRTEIINKDGRRFFIEVGTWGEELMRIDHVVDRDQQKEYEDKLNAIHDKIVEMGGFCKVSEDNPIMINYRKYQSQPYHWYKKEDWGSLRIKYTKENVLRLVNKLFDCNFTEMDVDYNYLTTQDYISTSN